MKKLYSLLATAMFTTVAFAQTTIYSENMGTTTSTKTIAANTFQNASPISYEGSGDVRATNISSGYAQASGSANVMINATDETFIISGINTLNYENIQLFLGQRKGSASANNELKIEVSADGTNWTLLSYTRPTGSGTANWLYINPTGIIPTTSNLRVKFTGTNDVEWRLDDVRITGTTASLATSDVTKSKKVFVKNTSVDNEIYFGVKTDIKIFNVNGQIIKTGSVSENGTLNIAELQKGIYFVTGIVSGKIVSEKIIKK